MSKRPKLGTYTGLKQRLLDESDPNRRFITVKNPSNFPFTYVDLFCGAGGLTKGFFDAKFLPISSVEISEIASETHEFNFPNCNHFCGDIAEFDAHKMTKGTEIDVVVGGPPCQGFSVAGKRDPNDPRNKLFNQFVRIVKELKPHYFVMENVPGIITMKGGKVVSAILEAFEELGYSTSIAILEAAEYGVPQLRSRAIFIGNKHGLINPFPAPIVSKNNYTPIEKGLEGLPDWERIPSINHEWTKHSKKFEKRISLVPQGGSLYETFLDAYKRQYSNVPSMTIKENHGGTHIHPTLNRCISAREMARLQSFPDSFFFKGSMKKAMWQIGNAVPPLLAQNIALSLRPFLEEAKNINDKSEYYEAHIGNQSGQLKLFN